jgi:hypothetical protein
MRQPSLTIHKQPSILLTPIVIRSIGHYTITFYLVFVWHCERWISQPFLTKEQTKRRICQEPVQMRLTRVNPLGLKSILVLLHKFQSQPTEPNIMRQRLCRPNSTRVFWMRLLISSTPSCSTNGSRCFNPFRSTVQMVGRIEKLTRF